MPCRHSYLSVFKRSYGEEQGKVKSIIGYETSLGDIFKPVSTFGYLSADFLPRLTSMLHLKISLIKFIYVLLTPRFSYSSTPPPPPLLQPNS
jgi:hypothetical protein